MLKLWKPQSNSPNHEDLFVARYKTLRAAALQLTDYDRARAEDLLHETFIEFTLSRPELATIENLDGYLRQVLRNIHLSEFRKSTRQALRTISIAEYDSVSLGLRQLDPMARTQAQDELRAICQYACLRKASSKAGSVFILRFFHGYFPGEIARLCRSSAPAISELIRAGRQEAVAWLRHPEQLHFLNAQATGMKPPDFGRTVEDWEGELRRYVLNAGSGTDCATEEEWRDCYRRQGSASLDAPTLAHLVSCAPCLDTVNRLLGLPLLAERLPSEASAGNARRKGRSGNDDDSGAAGGSGATGDLNRKLSRYRRSAKEVFEHRPEQLAILVNGLFMVSQKVSAGQGEQIVRLGLDEEVGFIEVLSEQGVRLLMLSIEAPPRGAAIQSRLVRLSDERTLQATISHHEQQPTLHVIYYDPADCGLRIADCGLEAAAPITAPQAESQDPLKFAIRDPQSAIIWWLRPGFITALLVLGLMLSLLLTRKHTTAVSAAELLRQAQAAEQAIESRTDTVLRSAVGLEERRHPGGEIIARRRLEIWRSASRGLKAARLFDEKGNLVAGEWRKADGSRTLYSVGNKPQSELDINGPLSASVSFIDVWRLGPSAADFAALIGEAQKATVEETVARYVISFQNQAAQPSDGLLKATLALSRADLRPVEQTLLVRVGQETREFRFIETSYERRASQSVTGSVFEPEPELLSDGEAGRRGDARVISPSPRLPIFPSPTVATTELEIEVLRLLNQARADLGEQVSVTRAAPGALRIAGVVETEQRKQELLRALAPITQNPAVKIEISAEAEAQKQISQTHTSSAPLIIQQVEPADEKLPVYPELRRYFSGRGWPEAQLEREIRRLATRVLNRSQQALVHSWAMRRLVNRFSSDELRHLAPEARAKWLALIAGHAGSFQSEIQALRQEIAPVFAAAAPPGELRAELEIADEATLSRAITRLVELSSTNDEAIQAAFTISTGSGASATVKTPPFWRSLHAAERLAARIQSTTQKLSTAGK